uniref:LysE family translocator n=1 Tax=Desulfosarcina cetonica TaxID=90730 RepID=UPI0006D09FDB
LAGLLTGMGAATADALYGSMAAFGMAGFTGFLVGWQTWIQLFGGLFLCYLGVRIFISRNAASPATGPSNGATGYFSALLLTLTNPMTILSFAAVFAGMGLGRMGAGPVAAVWLVVGVFCGSMAWWVILASVSSRFCSGISARAMSWINRLSGMVLTGFGLVAILGCLKT